MARNASELRPPRSRRAIALFCGLSVVAVAIAVVAWMRKDPRGERPAKSQRGKSNDQKVVHEQSSWDALVEASPYRNVRPDVRYVSDATCAECHGEIAAAYAKHPMG